MKRSTWAVVGWAVAGAVILGGAWLTTSVEGDRTVVVLNPLDEQVEVHFGAKVIKVQAQGRLTATLAAGATDVEVRGKDGRLLDRHYLHVPASGGGQAVYSVLGAAPIYRVNVVYTATTSRSRPGAEEGSSEFVFLMGERFQVVHADYLFREPPAQIEMPQGSRRTVKVAVGVVDGGWKRALDLTADSPRGVELAYTLARRLHRAFPGEWTPLGASIQAAGALRGPDAAAAVAEEAVNAAPESADWNRAFLRSMRRAGRLAELRERYRALAARAPSSAMARVMLLRVLPRNEVEEGARAALAAFPDDPEVQLVAGYALQRTGHAAEASAVFSRRRLGKAEDNGFVETQVRALLATGQTREAAAAALAAARVTDTDSEAVVLFARVARLPGANAAADPAEVTKTWAGGEASAAWVQDQLGELAPGASTAFQVPPSNHAMFEIVAHATRDPQQALKACRQANDLVLAALPSAYSTLLALEAYRAGDRALFHRLAQHLPVGDGDVAAWIDRGVEPEDFWRLDEDEQAAFALARARRLLAAGLPVPPALDALARGDVLRGPAFLAASRWPRPEHAAPPAQLVRQP